MNNVSGGFGINHQSGKVQLTNLSEDERNRLVEYFGSCDENMTINSSMTPVGVYKDHLAQGSRNSPVMPIELAAEIFPENARLQKLAKH